MKLGCAEVFSVLLMVPALLIVPLPELVSNPVLMYCERRSITPVERLFSVVPVGRSTYWL